MYRVSDVRSETRTSLPDQADRPADPYFLTTPGLLAFERLSPFLRACMAGYCISAKTLREMIHHTNQQQLFFCHLYCKREQNCTGQGRIGVASLGDTTGARGYLCCLGLGRLGAGRWRLLFRRAWHTISLASVDEAELAGGCTCCKALAGHLEGGQRKRDGRGEGGRLKAGWARLSIISSAGYSIQGPCTCTLIRYQ